MNTRTILAVSLTAMLAACSGDMPSSPTENGKKSPEPQRIAYSVQAVLSPDQVANTGIASPTAIDLTFRTAEGQLLDIVSATLTLRDEGGSVLAAQTFGPQAGTLRFRPTWSGAARGRKVDVAGEGRVGGVTSSFQFTLPL